MPETRAAVVPLHTTTLPSGRTFAVRLHADVTPGEQPGTVDASTALAVEVRLGKTPMTREPGLRLPAESVWLFPEDAPDVLDALHTALLAMPLPLTGQGSVESLPSEPIGPQVSAERHDGSDDPRWCNQCAALAIPQTVPPTAL